jgi:ribosomal protein S18 acetylase RimI-like enzyme
LLSGQRKIILIQSARMSPNAKTPIGERLVLRQVVLPEDDDFLRELYFASRGDLEGAVLPEDLKRNLLLMQYQAQSIAYTQQYPKASHEIVELDGQAIGRMMIDRRKEFICAVDISIIPERRSHGIGTTLLRRVMEECAEKNLPCTLQVLITNPARRLYERLGFRIVDNDGVRFSMTWNS